MKTSATSPAHTTGPWFIDNTGNEDVIVISSPKDHWVAEIRTDKAALRLEGASLGEARANARLIAAAPLLLEECKTQLENWEMLLNGEWDGSKPGIVSAIEDLQTVIGKAYGK